MIRTPRYAYVVAVLLGLVAAALPGNLPLGSASFSTAIFISAAVFGAAGLLTGILWPSGAWRWGFWVVAPGLFLVTLGLLFSGQFGSFLRDDLPFLASGLVAACLGGLIGARLSPRNRAKEQASASEGDS